MSLGIKIYVGGLYILQQNNLSLCKNTLLCMLDKAIDLLIENDICSQCSKYCSCDNKCDDETLCKHFMFDGLLKSSK